MRHLACATDRVRWTIAYTLITAPARDHATVRGVLAIRNATIRVVGAPRVDLARGEVVMREHMYRGQNWTLAYRSSPVAVKKVLNRSRCG